MSESEFEKIEKEFLDQMLQIFIDLRESIKLLRKKKKFVKSELCLVFICADTFSRFYKILQGSAESDLDNQIGERFKEWFVDFVFTDKNKVYYQYKKEISCNTDLAWKIRNSLVHFYGLPKQEKTKQQIGFWGGDITERKWE